MIVLRPVKGQEWAIEHAKKCADEKVPYDFDFAKGGGRYYCHEFTASCFPELEINELKGKILGVIPTPKKFLADSFYTNHHFSKIYPVS